MRATAVLGRLDTVVQALPNPSLLVRPLLRREAVESSRIEGTIATLDDLVLFEESGVQEDRRQGDVREGANYVTACEHGLRQPPERGISLGLIRELHQILLDGVRGDRRQAGTVRSTQNVIGQRGDTVETARFVTPPPSPSAPSALLGVSFPTAQGLIRRLERRGVLEEATGKRCDRVSRAREILAVLDAREALPDERR